MTDTCVYSFDPKDQEDSTVEGTWNCPHETYVDTDYCVFHLPPETRSKLGVTEVDLRETLLNKSRDPDSSSAFVGAVFGELELDNQKVGESSGPLDLRHTEVKGNLDLSSSTIPSNVLLDDSDVFTLAAPDAEIKGLSCRRTTFSDSVNLDKARVGNAYFEEAKFEGNAVFSEANFKGEVDFTKTKFLGVKTTFDDVVFEQGVDFTRARFEEIKFTGVSVSGRADWERATFKKESSFEHTEFDSADFSHVEFDDNSSFRGTKFRGAASFEDAAFRGWASFLEVYFGADASFDSVWFKKDVNLVGSSDDNCVVSLQGARLNGGTIETNSFKPVFYDLTGARVGRVKLSPGEDENPFNYVAFRQTKFNGFDFERHEEHLEGVDWEFHASLVELFDASDEVLEDTYRLAARDAKANDYNVAAKKLGNKEAKYRRRKLKQEGRGSQWVISLLKSHAVKIAVAGLLVAGALGAAAFFLL